MADIPLQFADIGNALAQGAQYRHARLQTNLLEDEENRRKAAEPYVADAMKGDSAALAKVAVGDPKSAAGIVAVLSRMDANQRAQAKDQADWGAQSAHAILQADPADRPAVYQQLYAEGQRRGYKMTLPPTYSPQLDGILRSHRAAGQSINEWFKQNESMPQPMGGGAAPAMPGAPPAAPGGGGPYGGAIAGIESAGAPNGGYGAVGPAADGKGSRAYGKYQIMDFNVGPWTAEILGKPMSPQEFLANPQAQDAVFNGKFGQYVQKYGSPQAAARAWFAGEGGMNNPGARDVLGTSVADYERKFSAGLPAGGGAAPGVPGPVVAQPQATGAPTQIAGGPPPAQMPGAPPQLAQGDTPQADGSGTPQPPAEGITRGLKLPPGARMMGIKGVPVVKDGNVLIVHPDGTQDWMPLPSRRDMAAPPAGYQMAPGGGLMPIPGGPADPNTTKRLNIPPGYQASPNGGLAPIPGGPADPDVMTRTAEAKRIQAEKAIPQTVTKGMQENVNSLKQLDRVEAELDKHKDSVGGWGSMAASIVPGMGAVQNRYGDPQGTQLRALIADIGSMKIHDRSGAAVTASEFPRLRPFIPTISDDADTIRSKLANFRAEYTSLLSDTASYYGPENGFRAYTPATDYLEGKNKGQAGIPAPGPGGEAAAAPAPAPAASPAAPGKLSMPRLSPADAAKLPAGTPFVGEDGIPRVRN